MSVADKILRAKADLDAVYEKGVADGKAQGGGGENPLMPIIDGTIKELNAQYLTGITSIRAYLFYQCGNLRSVVTPKNVTTIAAYAFSNCLALKDVDVSAGLAIIGANAFYGCTYLTNVVLGNTLTNIGGHAFYNCGRLSSLTIPDSVTSVGDYVFYNCKALESLVIGAKVSSVQVNTFYGCTGLVNVEVKGTIASNIAFTQSTLLSYDSITSIIEHLSDTATGKTLTFSKTAVDNAFKTDINPEGSTTRDWAMLVSTKSNWTIKLS